LRSTSPTRFSIRGSAIEHRASPLLAAEPAAPEPRKRGLFERLARDGGVSFGALVILCMVVISIVAPVLGTKDPSEINPALRNRTPGYEQTIRNEDGTTRIFTYPHGDRQPRPRHLQPCRLRCARFADHRRDGSPSSALQSGFSSASWPATSAGSTPS